MNAVEWRILDGSCIDTLATLSASSVHCCVTSPPYWGLRDYGHPGQIGLEKNPQEYVDNMVRVFREVRRVLRDDGTLWLNLGDSYGGARCGAQGQSGQMADRTVAKQRCREFNKTRCADDVKPKDLVGIPWRVAFALQADGWWLRSDVIWAKPNPMPESVKDRPTKAHEYVFMLSKSERYYFGQDDVREPHKPKSLERYEYALHTTADPNAIKDGLSDRRQAGIGNSERMAEFINPSGRNIRTVWEIATEPCKEAHFAVMPRALARKCILAGSHVGGTVLDPFGGGRHGSGRSYGTRSERDPVRTESQVRGDRQASYCQRSAALRARGGMMTTCTHKTLTDYTAPELNAEGRRVWRCTHCGKEGAWSEGWSYWGNGECSRCMTAAIDWVACSKACATALNGGIEPTPIDSPKSRFRTAKGKTAARVALKPRGLTIREKAAAYDRLKAEGKI